MRDKPTGQQSQQSAVENLQQESGMPNETKEREKDEAALEIQWVAHQYAKMKKKQEEDAMNKT